MGHNITAIIIKGNCDKKKASEYDLRGIDLDYNLTLFLIDIYYATYWQHSLELKKHLDISPPTNILIPTEEVIAHLVADISSTDAEYGLICTDYAGGVGYQYGAILKGLKCIDPKIMTINTALKHLGVIVKDGMDEFDSVGLSKYKNTPPYLEKYWDLCNELGL